MALRRIIVFVYLPGEVAAVPAGIFTHDHDSGVGDFDYGRRYLERDNAVAVDPVALPMAGPLREVVSNGGLYGAFRDASPDYWGRLVIAAEARVPPEALTEIEYLLAANATRVGNLDFRLSLDEPEPELAPPCFNRLAEVIRAAEKIAHGEEAEDYLLQLLRQGSSMGGARPKCTVEWQDSLWIAKFPAEEDTVNIPLIEYATMTLAAQCGIGIPEIRLEQAGGKDVFLVRRFDREKAGNCWMRKGFISALSLMQWDEADRLAWDYTAIAANMRRYMTAAEILRFFDRMVFNILVRNTDDHPRNHGFLVDGDEMLLSPAYDIVPALTRPGVGTDFRLAMSVGEQGREARIENAVSRSEKFGLTKDDALQRIMKIRKIVCNWRAVFEECGVSGREIDILGPSFTLL